MLCCSPFLPNSVFSSVIIGSLKSTMKEVLIPENWQMLNIQTFIFSLSGETIDKHLPAYHCLRFKEISKKISKKFKEMRKSHRFRSTPVYVLFSPAILDLLCLKVLMRLANETMLQGRSNLVKVKSLSHVWLFETPWTVAYQAPPFMGFSRQGYWSGLPFISFSRGSSWPRNWTWVSRIAGRRFTL